MFCTRCGNKVPVNSRTCSFCGYEMHPDAEETTIIDVKTVESKKQKTKKEKKVKQITDNKVNNSSYFLMLFSFILVLVPFVAVIASSLLFGLGAYFYLGVIISLLIEFMGTYTLSKAITNKNLISKIAIYLGVILIILPLTFIIVSLILSEKTLISDSKSIFSSFISCGLLLLCLGIEIKVIN